MGRNGGGEEKGRSSNSLDGAQAKVTVFASILSLKTYGVTRPRPVGWSGREP